MRKEYTFTANVADDDIKWFAATGPVTINGFFGGSGSGALVVKQLVEKEAEDLTDIDGNVYRYTSTFCALFEFAGDEIFGIGAENMSSAEFKVAISGAYRIA